MSTAEFPNFRMQVTVYGMGLGMFDTSDNSLMVYIFGPEKSRPFTQSVHSFVGVGFVAAPALSGPFLPEQKTMTAGDVCNKHQMIKEAVQEAGLSLQEVTAF